MRSMNSGDGLPDSLLPFAISARVQSARRSPRPAIGGVNSNGPMPGAHSNAVANALVNSSTCLRPLRPGQRVVELQIANAGPHLT